MRGKRAALRGERERARTEPWGKQNTMSSLPSLPSTAPVSLATSMDGHCVPGLIEGQEFESVQRSGLFGKLLSVDRESVTSMARSMR